MLSVTSPAGKHGTYDQRAYKPPTAAYRLFAYDRWTGYLTHLIWIPQITQFGVLFSIAGISSEDHGHWPSKTSL